MRADQLALQLYTVREASAQDFLGTLRAVAAAGYTAVEPAGLHNIPAEQVRATLDELGLRAPSAHVGLERLEADVAGVIGELQALGCAYAVVPALPEPRRRTAADVRATAEVLNELARAVQGAGMGFAYHNHAFEFAPLDSGTCWEVLLAETDPALVALELDVFWVKRGGLDPATMIRRHADRVKLLHLKDMSPADDQDYPAGTGALDWDGILAAGRDAGVEWYIVEQDHPRSPLDDVRLAYTLMRERAVA
jgi:sugar phosphate isomerase/epimerase